MKQKTLKNDILLVLAGLLLAGIAWGVLLLTKKTGSEAVISVDGEVVARMPLNSDGAYRLENPYPDLESADYANVVEVRDGRVRVSSADCPDQICVRHNWIQYAGESIVCLPHKLVVSISGGELSLDAVTQ